ncbi:hypothetical protein BH20ACI1_BH20ACI1_22300 [soil metagenome]
MKLFNPILADFVWAALLLEGRLLAIPIILIGLVVEYFFVQQLTGFSVKRSIIADVTMNAISLLLGILLIPLAGLAWEFTVGSLLYEQFKISSFGYLAWTATFILAVLINTIIEYLVLRKIFKLEKTKSGFRWLCLANALSVGTTFASFWFFPISNY